MVEIHSNFTVSGSKTVEDGLLPTNHAEHERLELTQGINDWAQVGFYLFSSIQPDGGWQWVGDHIRPRVHAPEKWHWPVGVIGTTHSTDHLIVKCIIGRRFSWTHGKK